MKKIFSLAFVALMALGANAQQKVSADLRSMTRNTNTVRVAPKMESKKAAFLNGDVQHKVAAEAQDTALYFPSANVLKGGWDMEGNSMFPMFFQHHLDTVTFYFNAIDNAGSEFGWFMSNDLNTILSQDSDWVIEPGMFDDYDEYYQNMMPTLLFANESQFYYGDALVDIYAKYGYTANTYWMSLPSSFYYPMTNCMMYTSEEVGGLYTENNVDSWFWSYENGGSYVFGTGLPAQNYPQLVNRGYTKSPDSLAVFFGYEGETMSIDTVSLQFSTFTDNFLPAGSGITVKLFDDNGLVGQYTATIADTVGMFNANTGIPGLNWHHGQLNFPIKGTAQGEVMALIYGFNQNGANIGFKADENNYASTTYHVVNGKLIYYWIANLAMTFNVKFQSGASAVENVAKDVKVEKLIENGQVVIMKGNKKYNVLGAEL